MARCEEDRALARAVVRGEAGSAEKLFDRVFEPLYRRVCARLGGDHDAAEEIVSETLLAGLRALGSFRGEATLTSWFTRIALRKVIDRKRRPAATTCDGGVMEALLNASRPQENSALEQIADGETRRLVREAVATLPSRHKSVLEWRYFDESSIGQVALRLNLSVKAAERRLARARSALESVLRRRGIAP